MIFSFYKMYDKKYRFSNNSDEQILSKINTTTLDRIKSFQGLNINYSLVITGTVGSGKSTMCESLSALFSTINIHTNNFPEFLYINDDVSGSLLSKKINGQISVITFQNFVLDNWECILKQKGINNEFNLFERCIDDSVLCFCNIANKNGEIADLELYSMYKRLRSINNIYNMPSYFDSEIHFTEIISGNLDFNVNQVLDIIESDLKNGIDKRIIGLSVSDFDSKFRIKTRGRDGENSYDDNLIKRYNKHYNKLFKILSKGKNIKRFLDMGYLV